jgi:hypothetical protein
MSPATQRDTYRSRAALTAWSRPSTHVVRAVAGKLRTVVDRCGAGGDSDALHDLIDRDGAAALQSPTQAATG